MKKLLIILPLLIACKYFEILMTTNDTLHLAEEHVHLDEEQLCEWMDAYDYVINDTVRIKLPNAAYKFKNK